MSSAQPPHDGRRNPLAPKPKPHVLGGGLGGNMVNMDKKGRIISAKELKDQRRRGGVCEYCGLTRTRKGVLKNKEVNVPGIVYRGYCLKCFDEKEVRYFFDGDKCIQDMEAEAAARGDDNDECSTVASDIPAAAAADNNDNHVSFTSIEQQQQQQQQRQSRKKKLKGRLSKLSRQHNGSNDHNGNSSSIIFSAAEARDGDDETGNNDDSSSVLCVPDSLSKPVSKKSTASISPIEGELNQEQQKGSAATSKKKKHHSLLHKSSSKKKERSNSYKSLFKRGGTVEHLLPIGTRTSSQDAVKGTVDDNTNNNEDNRNLNSSSSSSAPPSEIGVHDYTNFASFPSESTIGSIGDFQSFHTLTTESSTQPPPPPTASPLLLTRKEIDYLNTGQGLNEEEIMQMSSKIRQLEQSHKERKSQQGGQRKEHDELKSLSERSTHNTPHRHRRRRRHLLLGGFNYLRKSEPAVCGDDVDDDSAIATIAEVAESPGAKSAPGDFLRNRNDSSISADKIPFLPDIRARDVQEEEGLKESPTNDEDGDKYHVEHLHDSDNNMEKGNEDNDINPKATEEEHLNDALESSSCSSSSLSSPKTSSSSSSPSVTTAKTIDNTPTEEEKAIIADLSEQIDTNNFQAALETMRRHVNSPLVIKFGLSALCSKVPQTHAETSRQVKSPLQPGVMVNKSENEFIHPQSMLPSSWIKIISTCIMYRYRTNPLMQSEAIRTIWIISSLNSRYENDAVSNDGVDSILAALNNFPKHLDVVRNGAGALSSFLSCDDQRNRMRAIRCIQAKNKESRLLSSLEGCNTQDGKVEEWLIRVLYGFFLHGGGGIFRKLLVKEDQERRRRKRRWRKLPSTILDVMSIHDTSPEIQMWSCRLMWILLEELTTEESKQERQIPQDHATSPQKVAAAKTVNFSALMLPDFLDAIAAVTDAMSAFEDDTMLHEAACGFLCLLTDVVSSSATDAGMASTSSQPSSAQMQSIIESIVNSMNTHLTSSAIQLFGCKTISNLCSYANGRDAVDACAIVAQCNGINSILQAMRNHSDDISLQAESCGAIASLCKGVPWIKDSIFDLGGVGVVVNAARLHKHIAISDEDELYLIKQACMVLAALSGETKCVTAMQSSGIFGDLLNVANSIGDTDSCILECLMMITTNIISESGKNRALANTGTSLTVSMMKAHTKEEELVYLISLLHSISSSADCCIDTILSSGARNQILHVMQQNQGSTAIQESSCCFLSFLYTKVSDNMIPSLRTAGEIESIRNAMRGHQKHFSLQGAACLALRNFCAALRNPSDSIVAELFESMSDVVQASKTHPGSSTVQENVCGAFWAFSNISDTMALSVASSGAIQCIIDAMNRFPTLLSLQNDACNVLLILTAQEDNFEAIGTELGIDAIVHCLAVFDDNVEMSEKVCGIVAALSSDPCDVKFIIMEHEIALNRIIDCMYRFPHSSGIQIACSEIISNVSVDDDMIDDIAGLGGIDRLSTAMQQHLDNPLVIEKTCGAMNILIPEVQNDILMGNGVGQSVVDSMKRHPESAKVQIRGICALSGLCLKSESNKKDVAKVGGITAIIDAMVHLIGCLLVQENGCIALGNLSALEANKVAIGESGGIQAIISAMREYRSSENLQMAALDALRHLSSNEVNRRTIVGYGGIDSIIETTWAYNENENIQQNAFATLSSIVTDSQGQKAEMMTATELDAVVYAMKRFPDSKRVQSNACELLQKYSCAPLNIEMMQKNELLRPLVHSATTNYPTEQALYLVGLF